MSGFDRAQAAYDNAMPFEYSAAEENEIERLTDLLLSSVAEFAEEIVTDYVDFDLPARDDLLDAARESAIHRLKEIAK